MAEIKKIDREHLRKEGFLSPVALTEKLVNSLPKKQQDILFTLADLAEEEKQIVGKINSKRPTASGILAVSTPEGPGLTVCEDEDDWVIITMKERDEWKKIKERIAINLDKALDLGLGYLGLIQRQCKNYGVKP